MYRYPNIFTGNLFLSLLKIFTVTGQQLTGYRTIGLGLWLWGFCGIWWWGSLAAGTLPSTCPSLTWGWLSWPAAKKVTYPVLVWETRSCSLRSLGIWICNIHLAIETGINIKGISMKSLLVFLQGLLNGIMKCILYLYLFQNTWNNFDSLESRCSFPIGWILYIEVHWGELPITRKNYFPFCYRSSRGKNSSSIGVWNARMGNLVSKFYSYLIYLGIFFGKEWCFSGKE